MHVSQHGLAIRNGGLFSMSEAARRLATILFGMLVFFAACSAWAQAPRRWISSWSAAQQFAPEAPRPAAKPPPQATGAPAPRSPIAPIPDQIGAQTVRMIVHLSVGGAQLRVQLANAFGYPPLDIGDAHIARSAAGPAIVVGTDRRLTFGGRRGVRIPPGATVVSDPVDLDAPDGSNLTVSLYVPQVITGLTTHPLGLHTTYILDGNSTAAADPQPLSQNSSYFWLTDVDVLAPAAAATVAAFGDSITDGFATTPNRDLAWPAILYERLRTAGTAAPVAVVNLGISGNRVLHDGAGINGLARFQRDALARPGVRWVVLLEGINDISFPAVPGTPPAERISSADLIAGYRLLIDQAHLAGVRVMGATLLPWEGVWTFTPGGEAIRLEVNRWIRTSGAFDRVVDFDAVTRDPAHPSRLRPQFDSGDHVHPNNAGNRAMADAIDLTAFSGKAAK